jgi:hypothetical protein
MTMLSLPHEGANFHLRNGMYEEFAIMWPALSGIDTSFRSLFVSRYQSEIELIQDPISLKAEWLGNWVKQMCLVIKSAGLPEFVGKTVKMLTFDSTRTVRWFHLPEMRELKKDP